MRLGEYYRILHVRAIPTYRVYQLYDMHVEKSYMGGVVYFTALSCHPYLLIDVLLSLHHEAFTFMYIHCDYWCTLDFSCLVAEQVQRAFSLALAALLGENVYNFGELVCFIDVHYECMHLL